MNETRVQRKLQVGIPWRMLQSPQPRGAVKTAQAIATELCGHDDLDLLGISEPHFAGSDILFESVGLQEWLEKNPLNTQGNPARASRSWSQRLLQSAKSYAQRYKSPLKKLAEWLKLDGMAQRLYRRHLGSTRKFASTLGDAATRSQITSIHNMDAILSFECYDEIWDWPTENFACKMVGFFHDIPSDIRDEIDRTPTEYYCALGRMVNKASLIFCGSLSSQRDLVKFFHRAEGKVNLAHLGHDRGLNDPSLSAGDGAREASRQGISSAKVLAMMGSGEPQRNQAAVLRACSHLASSASAQRLTLLIIGAPADSNELRELTNIAKQHVDIHYTGYVPNAELGSRLRQCDVFLYPSLWEGFGTPILDAMTAGVPVVCSDISSMPEAAGDWGFFCDPFDPKSIADAIGKALALNGAGRHSWIEGARAWASGFTWQKTGDAVCRALYELFANQARVHSSPESRTARAA